MKQPLVSVITRTKDRPMLFPRALQSVLEQDLPCWEMIVVNDGGQPAALDQLIEQRNGAAQGRVHVIHREQSHGMEAASNAGIAVSSGKYVVIHDDDDSWDAGFLKVCIEHMEAAGPLVGGVVTRCVRVDEVVLENEVECVNRTPYNPWLNHISIVDMAQQNLFPPISFLFRRSVFDELGGFREDLPVLGDWEFNLRFLGRYAIDVIPQELANYHLRPRLMDTAYGNTVVAGLDLHSRYICRVRDELLRQDLQTGRFGMGFLANMNMAMAQQNGNGASRAVLEAQNRLLADLAVRVRREGIRQVLVYGAGEVGKRFSTIAEAMGLRIINFVDSNERLWGARIGETEVISMAKAVGLGIRHYVIASFAFSEEIEKTILNFHENKGLAPPEIYNPFLDRRVHA